MDLFPSGLTSRTLTNAIEIYRHLYAEGNGKAQNLYMAMPLAPIPIETGSKWERPLIPVDLIANTHG